jgi:fluoroquinolone resistance protein
MKISPILHPTLMSAGSDMLTKSEYIDEVFENLSFTDLKDIKFDNCTFKGCSLHSALLQYVKFIECRFESCDLSLMKLKSSLFNDVDVLDSKAIGIDFSTCEQPFSMNFYHTTLNMCSFYDLDMRQSDFIASQLHDTDFAKSNLERVSFKESDLLNALFEESNLKLCDFSEAFNYRINPMTNTLKSTKVSRDEAQSFLTFFDLKIV